MKKKNYQNCVYIAKKINRIELFLLFYLFLSWARRIRLCVSSPAEAFFVFHFTFLSKHVLTINSWVFILNLYFCLIYDDWAPLFHLPPLFFHVFLIFDNYIIIQSFSFCCLYKVTHFQITSIFVLVLHFVNFRQFLLTSCFIWWLY